MSFSLAKFLNETIKVFCNRMKILYNPKLSSIVSYTRAILTNKKFDTALIEQALF